MQAPLRILHTISQHRFEGPAKSVLRLALAQLNKGHDVTVAIDTFEDGDFLEKIEEFSIPVDRRFVLSQKAGSISHMRDVLTFKKIWMESSVDIIHCHRSHDNTLAAISRPAETSARLVRTIFTDKVLDSKHAWQLRRADGMVVMDEHSKQSMVERGLVDGWRVFSVSGLVDPNVYRRGKGGDQVLEQAGIEQDRALAGVVLADHDLDDLSGLLSLWEQVARSVPKAVLLMVHSRQNDETDGLVDEAISGKDSIRCLHVERCRPEIYRAFRVGLVLPLSHAYESELEPALQTMASAVPIIVCESNRAAVMAERGGGLVVSDGDLDAFHDALVNLLSDDEKAKEMGSVARREATREKAMDLHLDELDEFYRDLLANDI